LAELYYESGFLASAGKYWILTEPKDERIKKSVEIYEKSVNHSGTKILQDITFRGDKTKLSEYGKNKLKELELDSKKKSNYIPKFKQITNRKKKNEENEKRTFKDKLAEKLFFGVLIAIVILIIIGFSTVISWVF
jgi:hypothetical protein